MDMSLQGWQTLKCPKCDGTKFVAAVEMLWQNGLGTSARPTGHLCLGCNQILDAAKAVAYAKKKDAEAKIKDLEVELNG